MRVAASTLLVAVLCLVASTALWVRATTTSGRPPDAATAARTLGDFERSNAPAVEIDLAARYAGRLDLLDPRKALPSWHRFARDEVTAVYVATKTCPPGKLADIHDPALAKAYAWHALTCAPGPLPPDDLFEHPPHVHPSGRSYAALARMRPNTPASWSVTHARSFHVLELASLGPELEPTDRALAVDLAGWEALTRGDRLVLMPSALIVADHGTFGLAKVRVYPRAAWDAFAERAAIALLPRKPSELCAWPASPDLCWQPRTPADRHRSALLASTFGSAAFVGLASVALVIAYVRERRRVHADRIHVLRTLTHELRTPATSLRLDIEPLRAAYDDLPLRCQEPLLRMSDGIERLHRVLHRSARYMALFETSAKAESLIAVRDVPSAKAMFEELSEEWPEGVVLRSVGPDGAVATDREWLGVALKNLVENGVRHGRSPVSVSWTLADGGIVVRVEDSGVSPELSLRRAVQPYERDPKSPGLGLGLAIADRVARLLGGKLVHEPSPTVFELRLPQPRGRRAA